MKKIIIHIFGVFGLAVLVVGSSGCDSEFKGADINTDVVLDQPWGEGDKYLVGFHRATDKKGDFFDYGPKHFSVRNGVIYIADPLKRHISIFKNNKLVKYYDDKFIDMQALALSDKYYFVLDVIGNVFKIDRKKNTIILKMKLVDEPEKDYITGDAYTLHVYKDHLIVKGYLKNDACYSIKDFSVIKCRIPKNIGKVKLSNIYFLSNNSYVTSSDVTSKDLKFSLLNENKVVSRIIIPRERNLFYSGHGSYYVTKEGVYYTEHTNSNFRIVLISWKKK